MEPGISRCRKQLTNCFTQHSVLFVTCFLALLLYILIHRNLGDVDLVALPENDSKLCTWQRLLHQQHGNNLTNVITTEQPAVSSISHSKNILEIISIKELSSSLSENGKKNKIQQLLPNLPLRAIWNQHENKIYRLLKYKICGKYPNVFDLEYNNIYWQTLYTSNGTFQLYGAYYDNRELSQIGPVVRILSMINRLKPNVTTNCQLWFKNRRLPLFADVIEYKHIWFPKWSDHVKVIYQPYLITCKIPPKYHNEVPVSISLVENICDTATNILRVIYNKSEKKKDFAVCVKGLDYLQKDISVKLIEWIELVLMLGADKIFMYELQVHPNISKVLKYYENIGKVVTAPFTLPGGQPNLPILQQMYLKQLKEQKRKNELITYNDCLYKNMFTYKYIALLDIDEIFVPLKTNSWKELIDELKHKALEINNETHASYMIRNVYFLDEINKNQAVNNDIPKYMYMLQHVYRSEIISKPGYHIKCFHNTERVLTLHNHMVLTCINSSCGKPYSVNTTDALLFHYRADCISELPGECPEEGFNTIVDTTLWKFKEKLVTSVTKTLKHLGLL